MQWESLIARLPYPSPAAQRLIAIAAIITQAGIGVTGSVVRVTGSGLGCSTWPQCHRGTMFPVEHPEYETLNQWIEFGNRMLTGVVVLVAALCLLAALRIKAAHPERGRLVLLAAAMPAGVVAQAAIGGITVLTELLWWTVAVHFLASAVLVWLAVLLLHAFAEGDERPRWLLARPQRRLLALLAATLAALLVAGTLLTGAGPHGGDAETPRLDAPIDVLATLHGILLVVFLGVLGLIGVTLLRGNAPARFVRRYMLVWLVALAQGGLGSLQYVLGVPEPLVSLHVLGSALVVIATAALWCAARQRGTAPARPTMSVPSPAPR
ncbi:MAG: heme A synthase [Actinophytocola sp.]|nr:heme A synthase [Actinophytocola sp.]